MRMTVDDLLIEARDVLPHHPGPGGGPSPCRRPAPRRSTFAATIGAGGVPVTVIRAGSIIGHAGISWELPRQLMECLPVMVTPRWVATLAQPIAADRGR